MKALMVRVMCLAAVMFLVPAVAGAAEESHTTISYLLGTATSESGDFVEEPSTFGVDLDFSTSIDGRNEAGFLLGYQRFLEERVGTTFTDASSGIAISADQERSLTTLPFIFNWRHNVQTDSTSNFFFGIGAGGAYVERRFFVGSFDFSEYGWQFLVRPEAGFRFEVSETGAFVTSLRYDYGWENGDLPDLSVATLGVGYAMLY